MLGLMEQNWERHAIAAQNANAVELAMHTPQSLSANLEGNSAPQSRGQPHIEPTPLAPDMRPANDQIADLLKDCRSIDETLGLDHKED
jgi:hypothetical protein